jgi:hypothetical protein
MSSVAGLADRELPVPDHARVSQRAIKLPSMSGQPCPAGPLHRLIDDAGVQVCCAGQWLADKPGRSARRPRRKLHLAVDAGNELIVAVTLSDRDDDSPSQVGPLPGQIRAVASVRRSKPRWRAAMR